MYKSLFATSTCKDYLNEVVITELTGVKSAAWGFTWEKKTGLFEKDIYLAFNCQRSKHNASLDIQVGKIPLKEYNKAINIEEIVAKLNKYERDLGIEPTTYVVATKTTDEYSIGDTYILKIDKSWCSSTYMISALTLLIRSLVGKDEYHSNLKFILDKKIIVEQYDIDPEKLKSNPGMYHNNGVMNMSSHKALETSRSKASSPVLAGV